jgi:serine/threonine protein phosphatase PrpC
MSQEPSLHNGRAAAYHDNSCHGEDAFVIRDLGPYDALDAVSDGATGSGGRYASQYVAELLQNAAIASLDDVLTLLEEANRELYRRGRGRFFLTTLSLALKLGETLHVVSVGDSPVFLYRKGEIAPLTSATIGPMPLGMTHLLGQHERLRYKSRQLTLREKDWLIVASDGLVQNVAPRELAVVLDGDTTPEAAVAALRRLLCEKKRLNKGRGDDHTSFLPDDVTAVLRYLTPSCQPLSS